MIDENYKHRSLTKAWCGMCNYFMSISENGGCEKCPFKDSELCYDANEECNYDKFEELIKGIKINGEKETAITEISKFEWKEKTCEDIIEDMKNIKKCLFDFPLRKNRKPPRISPRGFFSSLPDYVLKILDYRKLADRTTQHSHHLFGVLTFVYTFPYIVSPHADQHTRGGILVGVPGMDADTTA